MAMMTIRMGAWQCLTANSNNCNGAQCDLDGTLRTARLIDGSSKAKVSANDSSAGSEYGYSVSMSGITQLSERLS